MTTHLKHLQTGYAFARCALEYGARYLPPVSAKTSEVARNALFTFDLIDTAYAGWRTGKKMRDNDPSSDSDRFYTDLAVKAALVAALAVLFVKVTNRYFIPQLNPTQLLEKTTIPKIALDYTTNEAFETVTAAWVKPTLENLTTGLFFIRTILDLYLARPRYHGELNKSAYFQAALHGATAIKASQYRTLEIKNSFSYLLLRTEYSYYPSQFYTTLNKFFSVPVKKVEAVFHLNIEGLSEQGMVEKIQAVYDYSTEMFKGSIWWRYWLSKTNFKEYYDRMVKPSDQAMRIINEGANPFKLIYEVDLKGAPPAPVKVYVSHEDKVWQPFRGLDIWHWIPQFMIPGGEVPFSERIEVQLTYPLSPKETVLDKIQSFFKKVISKVIN